MNNFESTNLLCHFELSKLKKAFPKIWFDKMKQRQDIELNQQDLFETASGDLINVRSMKAKHYYSIYVKMKQREPAYFGYWIDYFELEHDFKWEKKLLFKFNFFGPFRI